MTTAERKEQLLRELNRLTGLSLKLDETVKPDKSGKPAEQAKTEEIESDAPDEQAVRALAALCDAYKIAGSREALLLRWISGECSENEFTSSAARLHFDITETRTLYYLEVDGNADTSVTRTLKQMLADRHGLLILPYSSSSLLILDPANKKKPDSNQLTAESILSVLNTELFLNARIAFGSAVSDAAQLPEAFRKTLRTMQTGRLFMPDRSLYISDELSAEQLVSDVPAPTLREYLGQTLPSGFVPENSHIFEGDILLTADCFLKHDLNIAETARQLHVHRNTLLYRIDQIQSETGLDIRRFEDAMKYRLCALAICALSLS